MPAIILIFVIAVPLLWLGLFVEGHRLFYTFRERFPDEARARIKHAFAPVRHPSKALYFLSSASAAFLEEKMDEELIERRRRVVRLTIAALVIPFGGMAVLMAMVATGTLK